MLCILLLLLPALSLACTNGCSGHGTCSGDYKQLCTCASGWTAPDCSLRTCPYGASWVGPSYSTDGLHSQTSECSNMGSCDRTSGNCNCYSPFTGSACDKLDCPLDCSGHGTCMSLAQAGHAIDNRVLLYANTYTNPWDAESIYGCVCDPAFTGYDCSLRTCPTGDDPKTLGPGQVDEVQTISCQCVGACTGSLYFELYGETSGPVAPSAVLTAAQESANVLTPGLATGESVQSKLQGMRLINNVVVTGTASTLCTPTGATTSITFVQNAGNLPQITFVSQIVGTVTISVGECVCFTGFGHSDGQGNAGSLPDCGHQVTAPTGCPSSCSFQGVCVANYVCNCYEGFTGADCSLRSCPWGIAWWDEPWTTDQAHRSAECSNMGLCNTQTGECTCFPGFTGAACDKLACPTSGAGVCGGVGRCLSNRALALLGTVNGQLIGTPYAYYDVQSITCTLTSGSFVITYGTATSSAIPYNAAVTAVQNALLAIPQVGLVTVSFQSGSSVPCGGGGVVMYVTFLTNMGSTVPTLVAGPSGGGSAFAVTTVITGTRVSYGESSSNPNTWDANKLFGCFCDGMPNYSKSNPLSAGGDVGIYVDYTCSQYSCPFGNDPNYVDGTPTPNTQVLHCSLTTGSFTLEFRTQVTASIPFSASSANLVSALNALKSIIGGVKVATAAHICSAGSTSTTITFLGNLGQIPALIAVTSSGTFGSGSGVYVDTPVYGALTTTNAECSNRGVCDRSVGVCKCFPGYTSSDGFTNPGILGDCGNINVLAT